MLRGVSWTDYQHIQSVRGEHSAPRITYLRGQLQLMSPSRTHESIKSILGRLVEVYCAEHGIEFSTYGSWTLGDEALERGVEPDECYVFGHVEQPARPDLAIEVVLTSGGIDKLEVYRGLGVGEVWFWRRGEITAYVLREGGYAQVPRSEVLPSIDLGTLASCITPGTTSEAIRRYHAALTDEA